MQKPLLNWLSLAAALLLFILLLLLAFGGRGGAGADNSRYGAYPVTIEVSDGRRYECVRVRFRDWLIDCREVGR